MTIGVNNRIPSPAVRVVARDAAPTPAPKAANTPAPAAPSTSADGSVFKSLEGSAVMKKLEAAMGAKDADMVVAAVTGGLVQLAVERTGVKDLDQQLHNDYSGTIKAHVSDPTAQKAMLALGDVLGDKVASELISATAGTITGTTVKLINDPQYKKLYETDKVGFGKAVAVESGKNFAVALAGAFGTAKAESLIGLLIDWLKGMFSKK